MCECEPHCLCVSEQYINKCTILCITKLRQYIRVIDKLDGTERDTLIFLLHLAPITMISCIILRVNNVFSLSRTYSQRMFNMDLVC